MKKLILVFLMVLNLNVFAQIDTNESEYNFYNRKSMLNYVFGDLPDELFSTDILLDRNPQLEDEWQKYVVADEQLIDTLNVQDWFDLLHLLEVADISSNYLNSPIDSLFFAFLEKRFDYYEPTEGILTYPILLLDYDVNRFNDNAISNGNIVFQNGKFVEGENPQDGIQQHSLFFAGLFADTIESQQFKIVWDEEFILTNKAANVDSIKIVFNNQNYFLGPTNLEITLNDFLPGENILNFTIYKNDLTTINSNYSFYYVAKQRSVDQITNDELGFFDFTLSVDIEPLGNPNPDNPHLTYAIKYGCGNSGLRKPVFFVSGFGPASDSDLITNVAQSDCYFLYNKYNIEGLMDNLLATGHDIILVRFVPAVADVTLNAELLASVIQDVNAEKEANGSNFENVMIGYSSGALICRYTLDRMEYYHMQYGAPHPHTKLYVSIEGEHQGASVPLGSQLALDHMHQEQPSITINTLWYMANSTQARQLLIYQHTQTGQVGTSFTAGQGPAADRQDYLDGMLVSYAHPKQYIKYGYYGYPAFTRNIAIANGSRLTNETSVSDVLNDPFLFEPNHIVFEQENNNRYWLVKYNHNMRLESQEVPNQVFVYQESNWGGAVTLNIVFLTDDELLLYDNAPGGYLFGEEDMQKRCYDKMAGSAIIGVPQVYAIRATCFTPTISTLDIRNFTYDLNTFQVVYDLQENFLMYQSFDLSAQSNFYGYPVLGHPSNHFAITPFEAIYCDEWNQTHIDSRNAVFTGNYPGAGDLQINGWPHIKNFIMREVEADLVYLQNQQVGWNTNGSQYVAEYEASVAIFLGEQVSPKTDIAPYEILANGDITCQAEEFISITNGFHAQAGSSFHAFIASVGYGGCPTMAPINTDPLAETSSQSFIQQPQVYEKDTASAPHVNLYPNPSGGDFTIVWDTSHSNLGNLVIYDLTGKICYQTQVQNSDQLNLGLQSGVYVVEVIIQNTSYNVKLVVQ